MANDRSAGENKPGPDISRHCSAVAHGNRSTFISVYCGQTFSIKVTNQIHRPERCIYWHSLNTCQEHKDGHFINGVTFCLLKSPFNLINDSQRQL
ncbi:hypothetical protein TNCV_4860341 [Trichonephila clavipes]|nr:hypothetical protein TNCV_4860341 [Trichonephila clavipes]